MQCTAQKSSLGRFGRRRRCCMWSGGISSRSLAGGVGCSARCSSGALTFLVIFFVRHNVAFVEISSILDTPISGSCDWSGSSLPASKFGIEEVVQLQTFVNNRIHQTFLPVKQATWQGTG
jgi:hypothetical protein